MKTKTVIESLEARDSFDSVRSPLEDGKLYQKCLLFCVYSDSTKFQYHVLDRLSFCSYGLIKK